jgi:hypothetical protein
MKLAPPTKPFGERPPTPPPINTGFGGERPDDGGSESMLERLLLDVQRLIVRYECDRQDGSACPVYWRRLFSIRFQWVIWMKNHFYTIGSPTPPIGGLPYFVHDLAEFNRMPKTYEAELEALDQLGECLSSIIMSLNMLIPDPIEPDSPS